MNERRDTVKTLADELAEFERSMTGECANCGWTCRVAKAGIPQDRAHVHPEGLLLCSACSGTWFGNVPIYGIPDHQAHRSIPRLFNALVDALCVREEFEKAMGGP